MLNRGLLWMLAISPMCAGVIVMRAYGAYHGVVLEQSLRYPQDRYVHEAARSKIPSWLSHLLQVNIIIENFFELDSNHTSIFATRKSTPVNDQRWSSRNVVKRSFFILERALLPVVSVCVSILIPGFSSTMAFLGSFAAFTICILGPISARIALIGRCSTLDASILFVIGIMAIWGTGAAFWET
jgi:hypothetical protein